MFYFWNSVVANKTFIFDLQPIPGKTDVSGGKKKKVLIGCWLHIMLYFQCEEEKGKNSCALPLHLLKYELFCSWHDPSINQIRF